MITTWRKENLQSWAILLPFSVIIEQVDKTLVEYRIFEQHGGKNLSMDKALT